MCFNCGGIVIICWMLGFLDGIELYSWLIEWWMSNSKFGSLCYGLKWVFFNFWFVMSLLATFFFNPLGYSRSMYVIFFNPLWFNCERIVILVCFVPHCLFWCFWQERNARCFEDCERSILDIKFFFFRTLLEWSLVLPSYSCFSLPDLIDCCNMGSWFVPL